MPDGSGVALKTCTKCGDAKPETEFYLIKGKLLPIDSTKGYTPSNCRVVLWAMNMALSEWGEGAYARIAEAYLARRKVV